LLVLIKVCHVDHGVGFGISTVLTFWLGVDNNWIYLN